VIFSSRDDLTRTLADTYAACPYYQGTGTCFGGGCSAAGEPLCITNEPLDGWASETFEPYNPPNGILVAFRQIDGGRGEYADWLRDFDERPGFWTRGHDDPAARYPQYTPAEVDHAQKVLTRLARLSEWAELEAAEATDDYRNLPIHRTEAGYPNCATCDGGGCPDCTDPAY
jgi:hypothetical protein